MGKRLITQRRGKATPVHMSPGHRHLGPAKLPKVRTETKVKVEDIVHAPGRTAPVGILRMPDGSKSRTILAEGVSVGQELTIATDQLAPGNVLRLALIPEGSPGFNIESQPGDGGKFVRAAGTTASIVGRNPAGVVVRMPSGQFKTLNPQCRATIG